MNAAQPICSEHWISTPQGRLFARCWQPPSALQSQQGAAIVLLHDSLGCVALWRDFPARLAQHTGRTVITYDRLGFGQSDARHDRLAWDFIAEEAEHYFPLLQNHFGLQRFLVMGHSVGGGMAVHCAARHASACELLITESAQAFVEDRTRAGILQARAQFREADALQRLARYHGDKAAWVLDAWTETWLAPEFADWSLRSVLPQVRCPTLVLHGAEDEYGSASHPHHIASGVSAHAALQIMPATHHVPHREQELAVLQSISHFIRQHQGSQTATSV